MISLARKLASVRYFASTVARMAVACMPSMAMMPIEKMRIPTRTSRSMTPDCCARGFMSDAEPWVGVVDDSWVAHAGLAPGRNQYPEAAARAIHRVEVLAGARGSRQVDLSDV